MKTRNLTVAALALLLASCGNEEILENNETGNAGKVPMTFTLPATQTAVAGGFAEGLNPSWAQVKDGSNTLLQQPLPRPCSF